ncbi:unnamed protein product [Mesocestoides corti]|uniref:Rootletin-like coiled-coil domain-containing protein n=3 Tax=Mesocestoides corti TaxID=53468 RepID=A0A158QSE3_MESCO|nr:unnamed protein product [Mesocestoides corti]
MSTSETSSVTPQQQLPTESGNGETDISTNVESRSKELRIQGPSTAPSAISSQTLPERSGILAESQRLQREMLRAEMTEGVDLPLALQRPDASPTRTPSPSRAQIQLLESELAENKRKIASLQDSNQRHQKLIQTLQSQVTHHKRKNTDLEMEVEDLKLELQKKAKKLQSKELEHDSRLDARENMAKMREESLIAELENLTSALEQERAKSAELSRTNELLQDQLEEAASANQGLSRDVAQLTQAWRQATQQLEKREADWQSEEAAFNDYFATEHNRLLALWREVVSLRRAFTELRHQTARDFTQMNSEILRMGQSLQASCAALANNLKAAELESADALDKSRRQLMAGEADAKARSQSLAESLARSQARLAETEGQVIQLNRRVQDLVTEVADKERVLNTLRRLRASFPSPQPAETGDTTTGEDPVVATRRLIDQTHSMHHALSQIAQVVIADSANADADETQEPFMASFQHQMETGDWLESGGGTVATPLPQRPRSTSPSSEHHTPPPVPLRLASPSSSSPPGKLAETAVTGVQSALNRRAMQVQVLRLKLSSLRGRLAGLNKRLNEGEEERIRLNDYVTALRADLDLVRKEVEATRLERDRIKHTLSISVEEKNILERSRATNTERITSLQAELEQLRHFLNTTSKERDEIVEQRNAKQLQYESETRENARLQRLLEQAETRVSQTREELTKVKEGHDGLQVKHDALSQECNELTDKVERIERRAAELTEQVASIQKEKEDLQAKLLRLESVLEARECERSEMAHQLHLANATEARVSEERNLLRADCQQLRNQLSRIDAEYQLSTAEVDRLRESLAKAEQQRAQAEGEVLKANSSRLEVSEELAVTNMQLSKLKEEVEELRKEVRDQTGIASRLNEEREDLMRDKEDLSSRLSLNERERRQLSDLVSKLRTDREVLDNEAFLAQRQITELKNKVEKQETDIANLTLRRNNLQAEVQRVRSDFETELNKIQRQRDRLGAKYTAEIEELRGALAASERRLGEAEDAAVQAVLRADRAAAEATKASLRETDRHGMNERECQRWADEQARLNHELSLAQRERDDALLRAERERQKFLSIAAEDHAVVREKILLLQETISDLEKTLERTRRESASRAEKDDLALKSATEDLRACKEQLEECKVNHEKEVIGLKGQIRAMEASLERTVRDFNEVQLQLRLCEESRYNNRSEVSETAKLLREAEESRNSLRHDVFDLRKQVNELESIKSNLEKTNQDLRLQIRDLEVERVGQSCAVKEMKERLDFYERGRKGPKEEPLASPMAPRSRDDPLISELRQKLFACESSNLALQQTCADLRTSLGEEIANVEEIKRECSMLKQRISESEEARQALEMELNSVRRRHADVEERVRSREGATSLSVEETSRDCKRLEETKRILQARIEASEETISRLNSDLNSARRRLQVVEEEAAASSEAQRDAESRLAGIYSVMHRLIGFRQRRGGGGASPVLMLRSKRRMDGSTADGDDTEKGFRVVGDAQYTGSPLHDRRSRSISPTKERRDSDSRSYSADRRVRVPATAWSDVFAESGILQKTNTAGTTAASSSTDSLGHTRHHCQPLSLFHRLPGSDIDPESVSIALRELLRQMAQLEKERDDAEMARRAGEEKLFDVNTQLHEKSNEVHELRQILLSMEDKQRSFSERLRQSQAELLNHETEIRRVTKERDVAVVRAEELQRRLQLIEDECQSIQERLSASKTHEAKAAEEHRRELRKALEDTEVRLAAAETARRSLEANLHRQKTITDDKSMEIEALKARLVNTESEISTLREKLTEAASNIDRLSQECQKSNLAETDAKKTVDRFSERINDLEKHNLQLQERLSDAQRMMTTMDHDNRVMQERFENAQMSLRDCREQLEQMNNRVQKLQGDLAEADLLRCDLESQNRQLMRQNTEQDALQKELTQQIISLRLEKESTQVKVKNLMKTQSEWDKVKNDLEMETKQLREKLHDLQMSFDHLTRERMREKELNSVLISGQEEMRKRAQKLEEDNLECRRQIQRLSAQLVLREESHASQMDEVVRQRQHQVETELQQKCAELEQCEKTLRSRESSHRQRIKALEDQVKVLNEQLTHEVGRRQLYMSTSRLPVVTSSVGQYPPMSYLSQTLTHSHDSLISPSDYARSAERPWNSKPPQALPALSAAVPSKDQASSVSIQTESRSSHETITKRVT